jgi:hypothetical protein
LRRPVFGSARSVGDVAKKEGISQLGNLADKYFGGAGTPAQAIRVCAYNVTTLRKIVTKFRRELSAMSPTEFLRIHAKIGLKTNTIRLKSKRPMNERLALFLEYTSKAARGGGYSRLSASHKQVQLPRFDYATILFKLLGF